MRAKGYRKTKSGKYECFVSVEKDTVMLGTVETEDEAIRKVFDFRKIRLMSSVGKYGLQDNVAGTKIYTQEEKQYIQEHCNDRIDDVANYLNRNRETVRKYMQKARKGVLI